MFSSPSREPSISTSVAEKGGSCPPSSKGGQWSTVWRSTTASPLGPVPSPPRSWDGFPTLGFLRSGAYHGAYCVLVLEHIPDHEAFFAATARVVRPGGALALVTNHPSWTAPGSTPITDTDGEILWRPGDYFSAGHSVEPAGDGTVVFHHRSMGSIAQRRGKRRVVTATPGRDRPPRVGRPGRHPPPDGKPVVAPTLRACSTDPSPRRSRTVPGPTCSVTSTAR